ncbi:tetratricopeptide repeat protein [Bradyrhizobium sp. Tv2a-2]|uniref:O-linked N-acetylglucosamine transferase, SPINDLY family protein n=1 Tax=Bradyrhizobium sp. Tv2a-2 TaxID=113395 RepID=UPI000401C0AC|nr:tetratricopeptide repeat protein [Bradyrhizobium sp. Tv2a-2]
MQSTVGSRAYQNARLQKKSRKQADALLQAAYGAMRQGRHADAQALCVQILRELPDHFDTLHLLGVSLLQTARIDEARRVLEHAIAADPRSAEAHSNLGFALFRLKRYAEARLAQERALALQPQFPTALTNLGNTMMRLGHLPEAIALHERAISLKPDYADAYCNRGMVEVMLKQNQKAVHSFGRALSFAPRHLEAIIGKGMASIELRHFEEAAELFTAALAIAPNMAEVLAHRARLHLYLGRVKESEADFDAALALSPELELALRGKAQVSLHLGKHAAALAACNRVLEQNPNCEIGVTLLGDCLAKQGEAVAAIAQFDRAIALKPDYEEAITKKIFALAFWEDTNFAAEQAARRGWWERIGSRIAQRQLAPRSLDPDRRLVVGYVSSDFRNHSAALCFLPVYRHHDHTNFQIVSYSCSPQADPVTQGFRSFSDVWVDAVSLSDEELASRIEADKVDVLIDLSGHSAGNRLRVFASKPAPVQVTAWGHATGTGLPTIDCLFADPVTVPETAHALFAERVVYDLPCAITIEPETGSPVADAPVLRNGYVTFGVFNRIEKISDAALAVWSKIMHALPESRILLKHGALDDTMLRDQLTGRFASRGISLDRVACLGTSTRPDHLRAFDKVDISLDPFPQNGGVSTWESLQMGVPVVAKLGSCNSARVGAAIMTSLGLDDWVGDDDDRYIAIALEKAGNPSALQAVRQGMRARIAQSASGNSATYTAKVEEAYRTLWRDYCSRMSGFE